jgi:hypothetical protein
VQPLRARPIATTLKIKNNRLNMVRPLPTRGPYRLKSGIFKPRRTSVHFPKPLGYPAVAMTGKEPRSCNTNSKPRNSTSRKPCGFWAMRSRLGCRTLGLSIGSIECDPPPGAPVFAILAANRGYRPMTTVDQTTHFMRAVTWSDVLADARVARLGRS